MSIWQRWAPSFLSVGKGEALGLMGAFVLVFVIRMAGATIEQKEEAEASMRASEERFRSLVQNSTDTTFVMGAEGRHHATPARPRRRCSGWIPSDVVGRRATDLVHPEDRPRVEAQLAARVQTVLGHRAHPVPHGARRRHLPLRRGGGEQPARQPRRWPATSANLRDITERKEAESQLLHAALHDPLTGLPNRTLILDRADQMLVRARREYRPVAALFVDLDNFKDINDSLGHDAGDKVLQAVAQRFVGILREQRHRGATRRRRVRRAGRGGVAGRRPRDGRRAAPRRPARAVPHRRATTTCRSTVTASIGIAGGQRNSAPELLRDADIALYRAKALGKNRSALFQPEMQTAVLDRIELEADLRIRPGRASSSSSSTSRCSTSTT